MKKQKARTMTIADGTTVDTSKMDIEVLVILAEKASRPGHEVAKRTRKAARKELAIRGYVREPGVGGWIRRRR